MKVKVFSTRTNENFEAIRIGDETRMLSANECMEHEIQNFLDENPEIQIKQVQFDTVAIVPKMAAWNMTNADIDWEMEKSVLILFED